ncbi:hypothetical protein CANCADRAFT_138323 [Tortispora caseinolytica NRRL Y-17796]|uniref:3-methyl-2-oxobutanoate hydroxymethyltransferase n=1 Tax=Tortispora caseinolytica NRRL Y-17796 TaxID=767744 RepID=A0A1E4TC36_9ASCO|nr:hypothetical protein CANCADRAFT_138323 [Tortispora caseinolytica NRRL Y-17796]
MFRLSRTAIAVTCGQGPVRAYSHHVVTKSVTLPDLVEKYRRNEKVVAITAYDYITGTIANKAAVDFVLVGDSLAMVALGLPSTSTLTMDEMLHHCRAVSRAVDGPLIVGDLPYGSYEPSDEKAVESSLRMIREGGRVQAIKLEGGARMYSRVQSIVNNAEIPVLGHIGLTPQKMGHVGGFKTQGKSVEAVEKLLDDALALQDAGCFGLVIEAVPAAVAKFITEKLSIPTIGIGAGKHTSGQILVMPDMLGFYDKFTPKFVKKYSNCLDVCTDAVKTYAEEVVSEQFPSAEHSFNLSEKNMKAFEAYVEEVNSRAIEQDD